MIFTILINVLYKIDDKTIGPLILIVIVDGWNN